MKTEEHRKRQFKIPHDIARKVLRSAMKEAVLIRVDELDTKKSIHRQPTQKSIEWILNYILKSTAPHIVCIERGAMFKDTLPYFDFGASTMCSVPEYFLWIEVPIPAGEKIIKKYNLKQLH